jgi:hypothetical protein
MTILKIVKIKKLRTDAFVNSNIITVMTVTQKVLMMMIIHFWGFIIMFLSFHDILSISL